jgi:probable rRNA maturation factor
VNRSRWKGWHRHDQLVRIAYRVCHGEGLSGLLEISVLFCDDAFIQDLNRRYRGQDRATDVLAFPQRRAATADDMPRVLGDIVISLETVWDRRGGDSKGVRDEVRLLFCHGMLHLLGYEHASVTQCERMAAKQAEYLEISASSAWIGSR